MDIQLNSGLLLGVVSGIMLGIFALPQKKITNWKWENHWAGFTFFSAFLFPLTVALCTIPSCCQVIQLVPTKVLLQVFLLGSAWGIANIGYGISIQKLGIALGIAIVLGINSVVGTLLPILIYQPEKLFQPVGFWIELGILSMIIGIIFTSFAGNVRLKEQVRTEDSGDNLTKKSNFLTGVLIAVLTGVMAASFNFALLAGKPIEVIAIQYGATQANASNLTWLIGLSGGCLVTLCYCFILWKKNKTFHLFWNNDSVKNCILTALMGFLWFGGVLLYGTSVGMLGGLGASLGWPIIQSVSIGSGNLIGIFTGEFHGAKRALKILFAAFLFLVVGIVCIGYAAKIQ